eukprot:31282-Pelagococcus_subviridis.AAC.11
MDLPSCSRMTIVARVRTGAFRRGAAPRGLDAFARMARACGGTTSTDGRKDGRRQMGSARARSDRSATRFEIRRARAAAAAVAAAGGGKNRDDAPAS